MINDVNKINSCIQFLTNQNNQIIEYYSLFKLENNIIQYLQIYIINIYIKVCNTAKEEVIYQNPELNFYN